MPFALKGLTLFTPMSLKTRIQEFTKRMVLMPKLLYFAVAFFFYSLHTYRTQFVAQMYKVNKGNWGLYFAIPQCIAFVVGVIVAASIDKNGTQKSVMCIAILLSTMLFASFFVIRSFALFMVAFVLYFSATSITMPLVDKVVIEYLDKTDGCDKKDYGRQRMCSTIAYIFISFVMDNIIRTTKKGDDVTYHFAPLMIYGLVAGAFALAVVLLFVKNLPRSETQTDRVKMISKLCKNSDFMFLMFIVLLNGITRASMTSYINVFYDDHLGFNKDPENTEGMSFYYRIINRRKKSMMVVAGNVTELIMFFVSPWIVSSIGLIFPIFLSQIFQLVRFTGYYFMDVKAGSSFEMAFFLEMFKGLNFGLMQSTASTLAAQMVSEHYRSSAQLIYSGTFVGLGAVLAGIGFKFVFDAFKGTDGKIPVSGYKNVFLIDGILTVICIGLLLFQYAIRERIMFSRQNLQDKLDGIKRKGDEEHQLMVEKIVNEDKEPEEEKPAERIAV